MPLSNTTTFEFFRSSFNASLPSYVKSNFESAKNYIGKRYATKSADLTLSNTNYGYITLDVTYTGASSDVAAITFSNPNKSDISVTTDLNEISAPYIGGIPPNGYDIKLTPGVKKRIYVIVNGDSAGSIKTDSITIYTSVGVTPSIFPTVMRNMVVEYDCFTALYKYEAGVHVYSPWDAANTPKLTTYLCSATPISSWVVGTKVWTDTNFSFPAFPYYYSIYNGATVVYKVGGELDRAYGTKKSIRVYKSFWMNVTGKPAVTEERTLGPQKWNGSVADSTNACVDVVSSGIGRISEIINANDLAQPQKYKYYLGYDVNDSEKSSTNFFQRFVYSQEKFYPVTGDTHAVYKLGEGIIRDVNSDSTFQFSLSQATSALSYALPLLFAGIFFENIAAAFGWITYVCVMNGNAAGMAISGVAGTLTASAVAAIATALIVVAAVIILLAIIFWQTDKTYEEQGCPNFLHHYTTTPYIEISSALSRTVDLATNNNGYYSDGIYQYQQTTGAVSSKTLSTITGLISESPLKVGRTTALQVDNPTLVKGTAKLIALPYISGKPIPYCGVGSTIYYNVEQTETITLSDCAGLVTTPASKTLTIEASSRFSCVITADANAKALVKFN